MDGEQDGAQAQQQVEGQPEGGQPSQHGGQGQQPQQKPQAQLQVGAGDARPEDYEAQLRAKDAKIAELSAKVADAAKSQKAADDLGRQIARLLRKGPHRRAFGEVACRGARRHLEGRGAGVHLCGLVQRALRDGAISRMECATGTGLMQSPAESGTRGVRSSAVRSLQRGCQPIAIAAEGAGISPGVNCDCLGAPNRS